MDGSLILKAFIDSGADITLCGSAIFNKLKGCYEQLTQASIKAVVADKKEIIN